MPVVFIEVGNESLNTVQNQFTFQMMVHREYSPLFSSFVTRFLPLCPVQQQVV